MEWLMISNHNKNDVYYWMNFIGIVTLTLYTRMYNIRLPSHVCWDETHFGKMGSYYINRTFFFDVHPPLGKMLIATAGLMTGYNGSFQFSQPGDMYGKTPYIGMRMVCAFTGALIPGLCFCTVYNVVKSLSASLVVAVMVICDTGTITLSQYILLDPFLLCFIMASTWSYTKFQSCQLRAFTFCWWFWLSTTGVFLALAIGVKFVGLFVVLLVGFSTMYDLWILLEDLKVTMFNIVKHLLARIICLIFLPMCVYLVIFAVHFMILNRSGSGDNFFSSAFQSELIGNRLYNASMPQTVAFGSVVTIKNFRPGGAYLHSHPHLYPAASGEARQQQVTTYSYHDENNFWIIKPIAGSATVDKGVKLLQHQDLFRLEHAETKRNLHSHKEPSPITERHNQVTCYGDNGLGDSNDIFRLNIINLRKNVSSDGLSQFGTLDLKAMVSQFQLIHVNIGCALQSHNVQLPAWGFEQMEVTCNPNTRHKDSYWNVEEVHDNRLPNVSFKMYTQSFWEKFVESHVVMFQSNAGLKPNEGEVSSSPWQWPLNYMGQPFSGGQYRVYLLGNPVIWWISLAGIMFLVIYYAVNCIFRKRGIWTEQLGISLQSCVWLFVGWLLHYLPFWCMSRVLYFHHYFPAFLFSAMITAILIDHAIEVVVNLFALPPQISEAAIIVVISVFIYSFSLFSPLCYGMQGPQTDYSHLQWLDTWEF